MNLPALYQDDPFGDIPPLPLQSADDYGALPPPVPLYRPEDASVAVQKILEGLTDEQHAGATLIDCDTLILAGPGAGKTKTLTSRLAYIICTNSALPEEVLAVTFTNNAADEMRRRAGRLTGIEMKTLWVGTFHGICNRIIRENHDLVGLKADFTIVDQEDAERLVKNVLLEHNYPIAGRKKQPEGSLDSPPVKPTAVADIISRWKDDARIPDDIADDEFVQHDPAREEVNEFDYRAARAIYGAYNEALRDQQSMDFGDLILECILLFQREPSLLDRYRSLWQHVLVDEYQDANRVQHIWIDLVAAKAKLACVGDDDQSIYGWRGADVAQMLAFERRRPGSKIVRLTQNFRSTGHIVKAARGLISKNTKRFAKNLWTAAADGAAIHGCRFHTGWDEGRAIVRKIGDIARNAVEWRDIAILLRAAWIGTAIEQELLKAQIPYVLSGKTRFLDRTEIKDTLAYLRLCNNLDDDLAFERAAMRPKRGLGEAKLEKLKAVARQARQPLIACCIAEHLSCVLGAKTAEALCQLGNVVDEARAKRTERPIEETITSLMERAGYFAMLNEQSDDDDTRDARIENIMTLAKLAHEFPTISAFLEHIQLATELGRGLDQNAVRVGTMHSSKGLEFHTVFLPAWEEGTVPSSQSITNPARLEEERRVAYVGLTRAKSKIYISWAEERRDSRTRKSPFLDEIDGINWGTWQEHHS